MQWCRDFLSDIDIPERHHCINSLISNMHPLTLKQKGVNQMDFSLLYLTAALLYCQVNVYLVLNYKPMFQDKKSIDPATASKNIKLQLFSIERD